LVYSQSMRIIAIWSLKLVYIVRGTLQYIDTSSAAANRKSALECFGNQNRSSIDIA